jgi:hypothetical protein
MEIGLPDARPHSGGRISQCLSVSPHLSKISMSIRLLNVAANAIVLDCQGSDIASTTRIGRPQRRILPDLGYVGDARLLYGSPASRQYGALGGMRLSKSTWLCSVFEQMRADATQSVLVDPEAPTNVRQDRAVLLFDLSEGRLQI